MRRLKELAALPANWDDNGAVPPTSAAVEATRRLMDAVRHRCSHLESRVELPWTIAPIYHGGLLPEWRGGGGELEVHVGPDGGFGYLWVRTSGEQREFVEVDDASLTDILDVLAHMLAE
jgi:hypothetical protein